MYRFPKELEMKEKWINAIARKNWTVTPFLRVCARHFSTDDFVMESRDQHTRRSKRRDSTNLKNPRLKKVQSCNCQNVLASRTLHLVVCHYIVRKT